MCITLPVRVVSVGSFTAEIETNGRKQSVKVGTAEKIRPGDWVLATNDFLIKKIDDLEAEEILKLLGFYRQQETGDLDKKLVDILEARNERQLEKQEIEYLLSLEDENSLEALYSEANVVRKANIKDHICIHGIIEFSNHCRNNCLYCGLRKDNQSRNFYRLSEEKIIETAAEAVNGKGYKILVLQSGEDEWYDEKKLTAIIKGIKEKCRVFIYLSIGDREDDLYRKLKAAGANGVLYRFETSNPDLYAKLHNGENLSQRVEVLKKMKQMGYVISTGSIVGLPGQSSSDLASDILLMKELGTFMPSFGPLIPSAATPLANEKIINENLILKMIAVCRLVMPKSRIPITTAMETLGGEEFRQKAFLAGANSVMLNLTPEKYRKNYYIYANKFFDQDKRYEKWGLFKGELSYQMLENELQINI